MKVLELNSNKLTGNISDSISNLASLENLSLFDNNMKGQVPINIEKLQNLAVLNISYNNFNGFVTKKLATKDVMSMTMINDKGVAVTLNVHSDKDKAVASEE